MWALGELPVLVLTVVLWASAYERADAVLTSFHGVVLTVWYLAIAIAVLEAFWTYWMTLL